TPFVTTHFLRGVLGFWTGRLTILDKNQQLRCATTQSIFQRQSCTPMGSPKSLHQNFLKSSPLMGIRLCNAKKFLLTLGRQPFFRQVPLGAITSETRSYTMAFQCSTSRRPKT